jgi:hypothetical protein
MPGTFMPGSFIKILFYAGMFLSRFSFMPGSIFIKILLMPGYLSALRAKRANASRFSIRLLMILMPLCAGFFSWGYGYMICLGGPDENLRAHYPGGSLKRLAWIGRYPSDACAETEQGDISWANQSEAMAYPYPACCFAWVVINSQREPVFDQSRYS